MTSSGLLFVVMFLDWFTASGGPDRSAWQAFASIDVVLAATIVSALALVGLVGRGAIEDRSTWARALSGTVTTLAVISTATVAVRLVFAPPPVGFAQALGVTTTAWAWIGLLACCLLVAGGAVTLRRSREEDMLPQAGPDYSGRTPSRSA